MESSTLDDLQMHIADKIYFAIENISKEVNESLEKILQSATINAEKLHADVKLAIFEIKKEYFDTKSNKTGSPNNPFEHNNKLNSAAKLNTRKLDNSFNDINHGKSSSKRHIPETPPAKSKPFHTTKPQEESSDDNERNDNKKELRERKRINYKTEWEEESRSNDGNISGSNIKCEECNASFSLQAALSRHMKKHQNRDEHQHKCDECEYSSYRKDRLLSHKELKHAWS